MIKDYILFDEVPENQMKTNIRMRVTPEQSAKVEAIVCARQYMGWRGHTNYIFLRYTIFVLY